MKVVGSVKPADVPKRPGTIFGVWTTLAIQAVEAAGRGEVLVVTCADRAEYKKMRNGVSERIRHLGYSRRFVAVDEAGGSVKAYLQLVEKLPRNGSVAPANKRPPRKRA